MLKQLPLGILALFATAVVVPAQEKPSKLWTAYFFADEQESTQPQTLEQQKHKEQRHERLAELWRR